MKSRNFLSGLILIILFGCSKDDNPLPREEPIGTLQGVFTDSSVEGLIYTTETHSGITDENGNFDYEEGETVTFYIGDIILGSAPAAEEISPIDIASALEADINTLEVQNIAAFLQTLDEDGNPDNGIKITPEVIAAISLTEIDFSAPIIQILGEIVLDIFENTGISLEVVYPEIAAIHLAQTLAIDYTPAPSFTLNFLPTFTNYFGRDNITFVYGNSSLALNWVHEFDAEGNLIKSQAYEKYPTRILYEYNFSNYDLNSRTVDLDIKLYNYSNYDLYTNQIYTIEFDENYFFKEINPQNLNSNSLHFKEFSPEKWVTKIEIYSPENELKVSRSMTFDEKGKVISEILLNPAGSQISSKTFTYTDFGDPKTFDYFKTEDDFDNKVYSYRDDNTLEFYENTFEDGNDRMEFNEEEKYTQWTLSYDNSYQVIYNYSSEEKIEQEYYDGILTYKYYYRFEAGFGFSGYPYKWEWFEDGILRERYTLNENYKQESYEFFYDNGNLEYKDFYDEDGNWIYTEYYDEEGNLIETKYQ